MHLRLVDRYDERQIAPPLAVDNQALLQGHGLASGHDENLREDTQGDEGNKLHVVGCRAILAAQDAGQEEDIDKIRRVEAAYLHFMMDKGLRIFVQSVIMGMLPLIQPPFQRAVYRCRHFEFFRVDDGIGQIMDAAYQVERQFFVSLCIVQPRVDFFHPLFQAHLHRLPPLIGKRGEILVLVPKQVHFQRNDDRPRRVGVIVFPDAEAFAHDRQQAQKPAFANSVFADEIVGLFMKGHLHVCQISIIFNMHVMDMHNITACIESVRNIP